jgi:hypothetical protein
MRPQTLAPAAALAALALAPFPALAAPAPARQAAAAAETLALADRAARAAGGAVTHEIEGIDGRRAVVRGPAVASRAVAYATGVEAVQAGAAPVRLQAAREDAAIAALRPADRQALEAAFASVSGGVSAQPDAIDVASTLLAAGLVVPAPGAEHRPGFFDTSEFLAGRIAVNVVFVESTQPGRPWTRDDRDDAMSDLVEGLDMWAQSLPKAHLSFVYRTYRTTTPLQPISEPADRRDQWIGEAMQQLGSAPYDASYGWRRHYMNVYAFDNAARENTGADWAFTVFMVRAANSLSDAWHAAWHGPAGTFTFGDGQHPFTMLGGPYMVMPYSRILGIHFWHAAIFSHEFGHVFYALDEYPDYAASGHTPGERSGYFAVENGNLEASGAHTDQSCIMRGSFKYVMNYVLDHIVSIFTFGASRSWDYPICGYTRGQMGYRDANGNGRLDTFDAPPAISAIGTLVAETSATTLRAQASVAIGATTNQNPYGSTVHPSGERRDVSIDAIASIRWRVDGGAWTQVPLAQCKEAGQAFPVVATLAANRTAAVLEIEARTAAGAQTTTRTTIRRPWIFSPRLAATTAVR